MTIKILELFGGIGSPRVALRNLGIDIKSIDYVEIDVKAVASYNAIFASDLKYKTQSVIDWELKPDILIHGSPCQDISIAGRHLGTDAGSGTRSSLMWETLKIIENFGKWQPKIVIWENVKAVLFKSMNENFNKYLREMECLGYTNSYAVLNALDFGLPQQRERVFTISILNGEAFDFNSVGRLPMRPLSNFIEKDVDEKYTIKAPSMLDRIGSPSDKKKFKGYLKIIDDKVYTITTSQDRVPNSGVIDLGNGKYRVLTEKECWLLQGYSIDDFEAAAKVSCKTQLYKQDGNSIPVLIFESLFRVLLKDFEEEF